MTIKCKHCGGVAKVKYGVIEGKQRYKCKVCSKSYRVGDKREKYSSETKLKVIKLYLEGVGIMSIERLEGVPNPLIIYWIRRFSNILKDKLKKVNVPKDIKDIQILEIDELFSYCKKKQTKSTYGLLLIESEIKLLTLK